MNGKNIDWVEFFGKRLHAHSNFLGIKGAVDAVVQRAAELQRAACARQFDGTVKDKIYNTPLITERSTND